MEKISNKESEIILAKYSGILFPNEYLEGKYSLFYFPDALTKNYFYIKAKSTESLHCFDNYENKFIKSILQLFTNNTILLILQKHDKTNIFLIENEKEFEKICRNGMRELLKVKLLIHELNIGITIGHDLIICFDYYQYNSEVKFIEGIFLSNGISLSHNIDNLV